MDNPGHHAAQDSFPGRRKKQWGQAIPLVLSLYLFHISDSDYDYDFFHGYAAMAGGGGDFNYQGSGGAFSALPCCFFETSLWKKEYPE
jgi:hypothetical protein